MLTATNNYTSINIGDKNMTLLKNLKAFTIQLFIVIFIFGVHTLAARADTTLENLYQYTPISEVFAVCEIEPTPQYLEHRNKIGNSVLEKVQAAGMAVSAVPNLTERQITATVTLFFAGQDICDQAQQFLDKIAD